MLTKDLKLPDRHPHGSYSVNRAFMLGARGELTPPILVTIDDDEGIVFQFRPAKLDGSVEIGELSPLKVERVVCRPLRIVLEDGQNVFELRLEPPLVT